MSSTTADSVTSFVGRLSRARERLGPGGIAALRRGAGRPVGQPAAATRAFFSLGPPDGLNLEPAAWDAVTLWARHEHHADHAGSFGASLGRLATRDRPVAERLLARVLSCDRQELPAALRRCIPLLCDRGIPVDYGRLTWDLAKWDHPERDVQRRWARDFYRASADAPDHPESAEG